MDVFPADAEMAIDHAGLAAGYTMPYGADPTKLLDVEMDQLARVFALIAPVLVPPFENGMVAGQKPHGCSG